MKITSTDLQSATEISDIQPETIRSYYKLHARLYDWTRWTFLFGRNKAIRLVTVPPEGRACILEVGCGTGRNLLRLARKFRQAYLVGVDVSPDMLERASRRTSRYSRRVFLFERPYAPESFQLSIAPDVILCSYSLTMFNPGWEEAIDRAYSDLKEGGRIVVTDFHDSPFSWFTWWMGKNHVRMDGHLLTAMEARFETVHKEVRKAYLGLWRYVIYVGQKPVH